MPNIAILAIFKYAQFHFLSDINSQMDRLYLLFPTSVDCTGHWICSLFRKLIVRNTGLCNWGS